MFITSFFKSRREKFLKFVGNRANVKRLLVVRNGLVGDTVFVTPVLKRLRDNFPDAIIDFATGSKTFPLMKSYPYVDGIFPIPDKYSILVHSIFFFGLRKNKYDVVIVQEVNSHYTLMSKLAGGKFLAGFKNSLGFLLDYSFLRPKGTHAVLAEMETVIDWTDALFSISTELSLTPGEVKDAKDLLLASGINNLDKIVCIHPGCSSKDSEKGWVDKYYAELADSLIQNQKAEIIFEGIEAERELIERIMSTMKSASISLAGKTNLRQVLGILSASRIVIGSDTGTLHLANAVGTPVVMLFGRTDPIDTGPFDPSNGSKFVRADLPCIGCVHRDPPPAQWEICKNIRPVLCMEKLSPESVYNTVVEVLNLNRRTN